MEEKPLLVVTTCHHGKKNDGGIISVQEGCYFTFPACGRLHQATRDKYEVDPVWTAEQVYLEKMRERAAKARSARFGSSHEQA